MIDKELLKRVEVVLNKGDYKEWKNRDFQELSFQIKRDTDILISTGTLKRIFGKVKTGENYNPQLTTIEALILYIGADISQFQAVEPIEKVSPKEEETIVVSDPLLDEATPEKTIEEKPKETWWKRIFGK